MQHKVFHHAPQSILSAPPYGHHDQYKHSISLAEASKQRLKRSRKPARKTLESVTPLPASASASNWGAIDEVEIDAAPSPEVESEEEEEVTIETPRETKRRRRQLDPGDVGRFASLSIDRTSITSTLPGPSLFDIPPPTIQIHPVEEITATSIEEPEDENDVDMQARRGPTTLQIDDNRFYVTSLSDESEDEDVIEEEKRQNQIDAAMASSPQAEPNGNFIVNGELINRLQAMESHRRHALARDRSFARRKKSSDDSGSTTPTNIGAKAQQGALILWKSPKELSKEMQLHAQLPTPIAQDGAPPVVIEDGDYACVHRPTSPFSFQRSTSAYHPIKTSDEMEID